MRWDRRSAAPSCRHRGSGGRNREQRRPVTAAAGPVVPVIVELAGEDDQRAAQETNDAVGMVARATAVDLVTPAVEERQRVASGGARGERHDGIGDRA